MQSILEALFFGNINPNKHPKPQDSEYELYVKYADRVKVELLNKLNNDETKFFEKFLDNHNSAHDIETIQAFVNGYKLGSLLTMEGIVNTTDYSIVHCPDKLK